MSSTLVLSAYDLSDEGPARAFNEDATLVRDDLGLFAVADGAGGKGKGDVASTLALRTIENYVGATVRRTHERPDYDRLGNPEQARRLSRAVHQAHKNLRDAQQGSSERAGMATTVTALLLAPRTGHLHIAHVGDSRCYRMRHGRMEALTEDHSIARDVLERRPDVPDEVLARLPRNSVVRALGMQTDLRVSIRSVHLVPGDRFLLCTDGLAAAVHFDKIWRLLREAAPPSVVASELLSQALAAESQDNISLVVIDCDERGVDDNLPTRPYNRAPQSSRPVTALHELADYGDDPPSAGMLDFGPELATDEFLEAIESWEDEVEPPTIALEETSGIEVNPVLLSPAIEIPRHERGFRAGEGAESESSGWDEEPPPSYNVADDDIEVESEGDLDVADAPGLPDRD